MIRCPGCNIPIDEQGAFCGHCGQQLPLYLRAPLHPQEASFTRSAEEQRQLAAMRNTQMQRAPFQSAASYLTPQMSPKTPIPLPARVPVDYDHMPTPVPLSPLSVHPPRPLRYLHPANATNRGRVFLAIILALLLVGLLSGALTLLQHTRLQNQNASPTPPGSIKGIVSFSDTQGHVGMTDHISLSVAGLPPLPTNNHYAAWLVDAEMESTLSLGTLMLTYNGQQASLTFERVGTNVLTLGNKIEITRESGSTSLPAGKVILSAQLPSMALIHIKHLLVSFPTTPDKIGLLVGLREQTQQLYDQAQQINNTSSNTNIKCMAQNIIQLIEGKHSQQYQASRPECEANHIAKVDDGFGLLGTHNDGYVASAAAHASLAATQPDATDTIRIHAQQVINAMDDLKVWFAGIDQAAYVLLANPTDANDVHNLVELSTRALNGIDLDHDGRVDPVAGEPGALNAYLYGQQMATLTLVS